MGVSFGRASADVNYFAPAGALGTPGCGPAGNDLCINGSDTVHMNGPIGGVQAGYNWQNGNYLLGLETDFQGSGQTGTRDFAISFSNLAGGIVGGAQGTAAVSLTERMPWFGTVRGRVGYVANQWLVYATGGLAYGQIEVDSSASESAVLLQLPPVGIASPTCAAAILTIGTCPAWGFSGSGVTKIGWTVGGGTELALGGNWSARFEYLFVDLGSFDTTFSGLAGCFGRAHSKSPAQVALRFLEQQSIIPIPRSSKRERLAENIGSLDFRLSEAEMTEIAALKRPNSRIVSPQAPKWDS